MISICPTVTANDPHHYREQVENVAHFAQRIHLDFMDGLFVKSNSPKLELFWWPHSIQADLHMMSERPDLYLDQILKLSPSMVIIHAEAEGKFEEFARELHDHDIKVGVALLQDTEVGIIRAAIKHIDHVLIFSGDLGHFGGHVDLKLLDKVKELKLLKPRLEIGWDGGITDKNVKALVDGGVDVLNVGGYIQRSPDPAAAYAKLEANINQGL